MKLSCQEVQIVEKIIQNNGDFYLAKFVVVQAAGTIHWKLVGVIPLNKPLTTKTSSAILLESPCTDFFEKKEKTYTRPIVSPFYDLLFFVSQPTRAPNF